MIMDEITSASTYDEPTVMWRMRRGDGFAHAVIGFQGQGAWVMWFINSRPLGVRDFDTLEAAVHFSDLLRAQNWAVGWRLLPDGTSKLPVQKKSR